MKQKSKESEVKFDSFNNPEHYNQGGIECLDAIKAALGPELFMGYCNGNVIKYLWRHRYKGKPTEDLQKARFYLDRLILEQDNGKQVKWKNIS